MQAVKDGSLAAMLGKLQGQPQLLSAYARQAPVRDRAQVTLLQAALLQLQVLLRSCAACPHCARLIAMLHCVVACHWQLSRAFTQLSRPDDEVRA